MHISNGYLGDLNASNMRKGSNPHVRFDVQDKGYGHHMTDSTGRSVSVTLVNGELKILVNQEGSDEPVVVTVPSSSSEPIRVDQDAYDAAFAARQAPAGP